MTLNLTDDTTGTFEVPNDWVTQAAQQARSVQGQSNRMSWFTVEAVRPRAFSMSGAFIRDAQADLDP